MAIAHIQSKTDNLGDYVDTGDLAYTSSVTAASLLVCLVGTEAGATVGVSDNLGNTWVLAKSQSGGGLKLEVWYVVSAIAGATTVTVTNGAENYYDTIVGLREFSGLATSSPVDGTPAGTAYNDPTYVNAMTTGTTGTPSQANTLVIGAVMGSSNATWVVPTDFTGLSQSDGFDLFSSSASAYRILSSAAAQNPSFDSDPTYMIGAAAAVVFKEASTDTTKGFFALV